MTQKEYEAYTLHAIPNYAAEKMCGEGMNKEDAMKLAHEAFSHLLPKGPQTPNQFLFSIIEKDTANVVGTLWFGIKTNGAKKQAFIYEIILSPDVRGRGFGKLAMALLEGEVRKQGLSSIGLHVFGHNEVAIALYETAGYRTTNRIMAKDL